MKRDPVQAAPEVDRVVVLSMDDYLEGRERTAYMRHVVERLLESETEEGLEHDEVLRHLGVS